MKLCSDTSNRQARSPIRFALGMLAAATLGGCAGVAPHSSQAARDAAAFYWPYAALAADVYLTQGRVDTDLMLAAASPWLRDELQREKDPNRLAAYVRRIGSDPKALYRHAVERRCPPGQVESTVQSDEGAVRMGAGECVGAEELDAEPAPRRVDSKDEGNRSAPHAPGGDEDCEERDGHEPHVPVHLAMAEHGWQRAPELQRQAHPRGWRIFVPDLVMDVWRRRRPDPGPFDKLRVNGRAEGPVPVVEYAIVYRGTVGGGGWLSNFRGLTWMTPLIWDQYRQSEVATRSIVRQIYKLHALSDELFERAAPTRLRITAVGHSLGAGLAHYMFLRVGELTGVVGFDPSPIDGAALIPLAERPAVMAARSQPLDRRERDPEASVFYLYEQGEVISLVAPCSSGPVWGTEGGPIVKCESVDFSRGNVFRQHNMARLACKLFRAQRTDAQTASHEHRMVEH